ncbi:MAG: helicase-related protein, partial [Eubacteriales bacterium]
MYERLREGPLKGLSLGLTWGAQPRDEKEAVISAFSRGEISVLVATTVIEVGVNVPRATVMVIENADRFGLSQLHQLRGRVGRGAAESWCFLTGENNERLQTLCATNDGFIVAQKDLELRGPGDFLGTRQSGRLAPDGFGVEDMLLIEETREAAAMLFEQAGLRGEARALKARALKRYERALKDIALN